MLTAINEKVIKTISRQPNRINEFKHFFKTTEEQTELFLRFPQTLLFVDSPLEQAVINAAKRNRHVAKSCCFLSFELKNKLNNIKGIYSQQPNNVHSSITLSAPLTRSQKRKLIRKNPHVIKLLKNIDNNDIEYAAYRDLTTINSKTRLTRQLIEKMANM